MFIVGKRKNDKPEPIINKATLDKCKKAIEKYVRKD